jgi:ABC-type polysaccharide/polyol phosphate export permease
VLADKSPWFAYASLINPQLYIMEGMRAAILGQTGYLNFWLCAGMTLFFSIICGAHAIVKIQRRLDFV